MRRFEQIVWKALGVMLLCAALIVVGGCGAAGGGVDNVSNARVIHILGTDEAAGSDTAEQDWLSSPTVYSGARSHAVDANDRGDSTARAWSPAVELADDADAMNEAEAEELARRVRVCVGGICGRPYDDGGETLD